jgi:nucleotide-binding universal stress UspA family protein
MKIVLAVDGSDQSYFAARALEHLAKLEKVTVLHAIDLPLPSFPTIVPEVANELDRMAERKLREEGERVLRSVASILPPHTGPVSKRLEAGKPAEMILNVAEEVKAGMIVLGARGLGPVRELLLGSVSHRVATYAPCPALIVNRALVSLNHVLLPVQGPDDAKAAVKFLATKPFKEVGEVRVLSAIPYVFSTWLPDASVQDSLINAIVKNVQSFVDEVVSRLIAQGYRATGMVSKDPPTSAILQEVETSKPDLILMGSRGLKGVARFLLGSVAHAILHRAPCPVLIFR